MQKFFNLARERDARKLSSRHVVIAVVAHRVGLAQDVVCTSTVDPNSTPPVQGRNAGVIAGVDGAITRLPSPKTHSISELNTGRLDHCDGAGIKPESLNTFSKKPPTVNFREMVTTFAWRLETTPSTPQTSASQP
ncbi:hypothetical protein CORC01_10850 [Colletotrichum orchidophilum]|uniref:Uncharacterized protein n=1 Tax=Colletotrichum orchidophilum TaxID=1209926 RepID=A0A1G4AXE3_9PEZI|nr:uncharacterized protein CORC01_10850 [Colletotrichum orchidophilum]OHE93829.1 hypothetical protein CORC01_10850 [Colletotrichum orchidophilum]